MKLTIFSLLAFFSATGSVAQMLPDSIEWFYYDPTKLKYTDFPMSTYHYKYDQYGNIVEEITRAESKNSFKRTYAYTNGRKVDDIQYGWNNSKAAWVPIKRYHRLSNQFDIDTVEIYSIYDTLSSSFIEKIWHVYSIEYDSVQRPMRITFKDYHISDQTWKIERKIEFSYSGADSLPYEVYRGTWDGAKWSNERRVTQLSWDLGFFTKIENVYPSGGITHRRDGMNWVNMVYDSSVIVNDRMEDQFTYLYNEDSMKFIRYRSNHTRYDVLGNEISVVLLNWANGLSDTNSVSLNEFKYGSNGEVTERVGRNYNKIATENKSKYLYYYGATLLVSAESLWGNIYPNPVGPSQKLFIQSVESIKQIQLYSFAGVLLRNWNEIDMQGMDIHGLAPGMYFIRLQDESGSSITKRLQIQ